MNWKKILTIAALTGFSASVATGQGTAPTIVQGDYISNVFGNSNFIKNPNAKLNTKDVTVSSATVSRSPTTPLVATSEFNVAITSADGTVTWATRTFDAGMKGQNCEARFTYRGFQSTSKAHIKQGANTVATLNLSATGTDPRIASINFPCGDLSTATTFVITDTSTLGGTNEIGGIYLGLATNQANVAQAEVLFRAQDTNGASIPQGTPTTVVFPSVVFDSLGAYNASTGSYTIKKAGRYSIHARVAFAYGAYGANSDNYLLLNKNGASFSTAFWSTVAFTGYPNPQITGVVDLAVGDVVTVNVVQNTGASRALLGSNALWSEFSISRFPTSSELVVTPERQNVFGGVKYNGTSDYVLSNTSAIDRLIVNTIAFGSANYFGKATASAASCGLATNDVGFCLTNVPPGTYSITSNLQIGNTGTGRLCTAAVNVAGTSLSATSVTQGFAYGPATNQEDWSMSGSGILTVTSFQPQLRVYATISANPSSGSCRIRSAPVGTTIEALPAIVISPLDQPSNSALYVEGPVKASATGAAIPAGYVGEVKRASIGYTNFTGSTYVSLQSLQLTPGVWLCSSQARIARNLATVSTNFEFVSCLGGQSGGICIPAFDQQTIGNSYISGLSNTFNYVQVGSIPLQIRYDGTNLTFANGTTVASATGTIYQQIYLDATAGTPQATGRIECTRLN